LELSSGGVLAAANYLGYFAGALLAMLGWVSARAGVLSGLILIPITTFSMGLTRELSVWVLMRAVAGVASAWVLIYVTALCVRLLANESRAALKGVVFSGVGAGIAVVGSIALASMSLVIGSFASWQLLAAVSLVATLCLLPIFSTLSWASPSACLVAGKMAWNSERLRLVLCYGSFGFAYIIPATYLPIIAKDAIPNPLTFGWSWPLFGVAAAASTIGAAALGARVSNRSIWRACHVVMAIGVTLPLITESFLAICLSGVLVGGTFMVATMAGIQEARAAANEHATTLTAAMTTAFALGQVAGPIVANYFLYATAGTQAALLLGAVLLLGSSAVLTIGSGSPPAYPKDR
jgi:predicted MFS family arabinose efflux permease